MSKRQKSGSYESISKHNSFGFETTCKTRRRSKVQEEPNEPLPFNVKKESKTDVEWLNQELPNVWNMTSEDLHKDPPARMRNVEAEIFDQVPMTTFKTAILENRHFFSNRTVLVIGCNMLTIPLWAADCGAKLVIVVDKSHALEYLRLVVNSQKKENVIKLVLYRSRIQDIKLPIKTVDTIVCNWMGLSLLGDSKCHEVIYARDKWLNNVNGVILPDKAQLFLAGIENSQKKRKLLDWWGNVYDFNMKAMRSLVLRSAVHQKVDKKEVMTAPLVIWEIDMLTATYKDLKVKWKGSLEISRPGLMNGLVTYFKVYFSSSHKPVGFSTSPSAPMTNWMQTIFYLDEPIRMEANKTLNCKFAMSSKRCTQKLTNVNVDFKITGTAGKMKWSLCQSPPLIEAKEKAEKNDVKNESLIKTEAT